MDMIMNMMPKQFDSNEWFIIITILVGYTIVWQLPKRFPSTVTIMIFSFCLFVSITTDELLAAPPYNLYDMNDSPKNDISDLLMWFMYGPFGYLFVYFYDRWQIKGISIVVYIVVWSSFSVGFEWLAMMAHIFKYKNWSIGYSFPIYILVDSLLILYYHFIWSYFYKIKKTRAKTEA